jgi:hypothetical protein
MIPRSPGGRLARASSATRISVHLKMLKKENLPLYSVGKKRNMEK